MNNTKFSLDLVRERIQKMERNSLKQVKGGASAPCDPPPIEEFTSQSSQNPRKRLSLFSQLQKQTQIMKKATIKLNQVFITLQKVQIIEQGALKNIKGGAVSADPPPIEEFTI